MEFTDTNYYGEQIYNFEYSPDPVINKLSEDEVEDADSYHKFKIAESQTGTDIIVSQVENGDKNRFKFKITDEETQQCRYTGSNPDNVPPTVLHAVHENGYSVNNVESLGDWFNIWLDVKLTRIALHDLVADPTDPIHDDILKDIGLSLHGLEELAGVRYLIDDPEEFGSLVDNSDRFELLGPLNAPDESIEEHEADQEDMEGELVRNVEIIPKEEPLLSQVPEKYRSERKDEVFNPDNFEVDNVIVKAVFPQDDSTAFADILTPWGVERFNFHIDGSCHYIKSEHAQSERPNSYVIDAIQSQGYDVENASSLFESVDTGSVVRTCIDVLDKLAMIGDWRNRGENRAGPEGHIASITRINMLRLLVAVEAAEIAPGPYEKWQNTYAGVYHQNENAGPTVVQQVVKEMGRNQQKELGDRLAKSESIQKSVIEPNFNSGLQLAQNIGMIL